MAKVSNSKRRSRTFERKKLQAERGREQKTTVLVFGEDKACRELFKAVLQFCSLHEDYYLKFSFGTGSSPIDVVKDAYRYQNNNFDKILILMDNDFVEQGKIGISEVLAQARKNVPDKRNLSKSPSRTETKIFAITPNCVECFLLKLTKKGTVSTKKCRDCKEKCGKNKIDVNSYRNYSKLIDKDHFKLLCRLPEYIWLKQLVSEIEEGPSD